MCNIWYIFTHYLVVINELDGLSQDRLAVSNARYSHSGAVKNEAIKALEFLEAQFEGRNQRLKAVTISGTELSSITFRTEETDKQVGVVQ